MSDASRQKILCVRVTGSDDALRDMLARHPGEAYSIRRIGERVSAEVFLPEAAVEQIDRKQVDIEVLYDASARGGERQKEVGKGNRFEGDQRRFQGLGAKTREEPR
jgi:hypothetical protein